MKCPVDQSDLVMSERQGVEIDYCPTCRGVWLDRGELDKIVDRAAAVAAPSAPPAPARAPAAPPSPTSYPRDDRRDARPAYGSYDDRDRRDGSYDPRYDQRDPRYRKKKRESWLEDLFDF